LLHRKAAAQHRRLELRPAAKNNSTTTPAPARP
jgi:hypothetical protein